MEYNDAMILQDMSLDGLERRADETARLLGHLANKHRLMILCRLALEGELTVNALCAATALSQSAASQHLARLREDALIGTRRDGTFMIYHIADPRALQVLRALQEIMCPRPSP